MSWISTITHYFTSGVRFLSEMAYESFAACVAFIEDHWPLFVFAYAHVILLLLITIIVLFACERDERSVDKKCDAITHKASPRVGKYGCVPSSNDIRYISQGVTLRGRLPDENE